MNKVTLIICIKLRVLSSLKLFFDYFPVIMPPSALDQLSEYHHNQVRIGDRITTYIFPCRPSAFTHVNLP